MESRLLQIILVILLLCIMVYPLLKDTVSNLQRYNTTAKKDAKETTINLIMHGLILSLAIFLLIKGFIFCIL